MVKKLAIGSIAVLSLCGGFAAYAAEPGTYAGASYGQAAITADEIGFDESDTGFKVFVGYTFNSYAAIELNYVDAGAPLMESPVCCTEISAKAVIASALVSFPFQRSFAAFAKLGFAFYDSDTTTLTSETADTDVNLAYGIGASFGFLERYEVRLEYESIAVDEGDFSMLSIGGVYRF